MFHPREKNVSPEGKSVSVTFYLKPLKNNPTDSSVVARVLYGRKKTELSTGIRIPKVTRCILKRMGCIGRCNL